MRRPNSFLKGLMVEHRSARFIAAVAAIALAAGLAAFSTFAVVDAFAGPNPSASLLNSFAKARTAPLQVMAGR